MCLAVTITGDFFLTEKKKKNQERQRFTNGDGYSPSSSSATNNPYFDDFIFYSPPNNTLKCFTFYPHPHKSLLPQTAKMEGEKHISCFSKFLLIFWPVRDWGNFSGHLVQGIRDSVAKWLEVQALSQTVWAFTSSIALKS